MYVCTHVCTHARTHVCMYACTHARMYVCMYVRTYVCMYVCHVCMQGSDLGKNIFTHLYASFLTHINVNVGLSEALATQLAVLRTCIARYTQERWLQCSRSTDVDVLFTEQTVSMMRMMMMMMMTMMK